MRLILCLVLLLPFVFSEIQIEVNSDSNARDSKQFDLRSTIHLSCKVSSTEKDEKVTVKWEKNGKEVKEMEGERYQDATSGNSFGFKLATATLEDAGEYSCAVFVNDKEVKRANLTLFSKVHIKSPSNVNFVEGEMIKIQCLVIANPKPIISWKIGNETYEESRGRVVLEDDEEHQLQNGYLVIKEAEMKDRGEYECIASSEQNDDVFTSKTIVRIKDKYAALWPFLGICAEVFVLCAIILIYEKKRNKSELEESDTDQSPDQKNTPDHGKDSNLRHRQ